MTFFCFRLANIEARDRLTCWNLVLGDLAGGFVEFSWNGKILSLPGMKIAGNVDEMLMDPSLFVSVTPKINAARCLVLC